MKKKIVMFAVLLSLLVGFALPGSQSITAMAEEVGENYDGVVEYIEELGDSAPSFSTTQCIVVYTKVDGTISLFKVSGQKPYVGMNGDKLLLCIDANHNRQNYDLESGVWVYDSNETAGNSSFFASFRIGSVLACSHDLYYADGQLYFDCTPKYMFNAWCVDAGLNCAPSSSSNEEMFELYEYDPYYRYIVTSSGGGYEVAQIYSNEELDTFTELVSYDNKLYIHLKDDIELGVSVKRYVYENDGWVGKSSNYYNLEYSKLADLEIAVSETNKLVFSSNTIKTGNSFGNVYYEASAGFDSAGFSGEENPDANPLTTPTPTPEIPPSGGSGSASGFDIITYSSQIKAEVKADSVNMRDKPSLEGNVVASFIKTWNVDVLGYVYADDGAVWYYCKTVRDDMEYIGFIKAEYLTVLSVENNDFNIDFGDIDLEDTPELITTAKNSFIELLGFVGVVPMMIAVVFGFLPSWCLGIVGVSVVVICLLAIIKRG